MDVRLQQEAHGSSGPNGSTVTVQLGPVPVFTQWVVDQISTFLSRGSGVVVLTHGPTIAAPIDLDATNIAQSNQSAPNNWILYPGEILTASFTKLQPNVTAGVTLRGTQTDWRG